MEPAQGRVANIFIILKGIFTCSSIHYQGGGAYYTLNQEGGACGHALSLIK